MSAQQRDTLREVPTVFWGEPRRRTFTQYGQVLVVESLRVRQQIICDMLTRECFGCGVVEDPREAVRLLSQGLYLRKARMPELIICNARVVGDAGLKALARLRMDRPDVQVIVFSAFSTPLVRAAMARIGGARVLDQSFGLADLRAISLSLVTSRRRSG